MSKKEKAALAMEFLVNATGRRSKRAAGARKVHASTGRAASRRRQQQGGGMAKKKGGKKKGAHKSGGAKHHKSGRGRFHKNPPGIVGSLGVKQIPRFAMDAAIDAAEAVGGVIFVRRVRGLTGQMPGTIPALGIEAGLAIVGGFALSKVNRRLGANIARGGLMAPMMTFVQQRKLPFGISEALGDDGFLLGDGLGAYELEGGRLSGYVGSGERVGDFIGDGQAEWN
jgi:hypothetical protein